MFYGVTDITTFILGTIIIVLLPGPNSLYVMTIASRFGLAAGYRGAAGIFVGDLILMTLAATGAASLIHAFPAIFTLLQYAGAGYLAWLGLGLLRAAYQRWGVAPANLAADVALATNTANSARPFRVALLISLMNPKAILFYISFFIQFVAPDYPYPALSFLILGLVVQTCSLIYLSALIVGGSYLAQLCRQHPRFTAFSTALTGMAFIGFGAKLMHGGLR